MLESVILGIVQGLTEFIPVSSTAHLILFPRIFGWSGAVDSLTFDVALHLGTTLALIGYFWKDWVNVLRHRRTLLVQLVIATIPVAGVGLLFKHVIEERLRNPMVIAFALVVFGGVMLLAERAKTSKTVADITLRDALIVGCAQVLALIPGVSRSGITISAGLFAGYKRPEAARFSFLLSTPAIVAATLLESRKILHGFDADVSVFAAGFMASLLSGLAALGFLMRYLSRRPVNVFVYYRLLLALGVILFL